MLAFFNLSIPPIAFLLGSATAIIIFLNIFDLIIASTHGGLFPKCAQGSKVTYKSASLTGVFRDSIAFTSACFVPNAL